MARVHCPLFGAAVVCAMAAAAAAAAGGVVAPNPPPNADALRAEVQIGLCAPAAEIVRALDLRPRGGPIEVWQFDDGDLTLLDRGVRLRLRVAADGRSTLTLKVADQDCARLDRGLVPRGQGKCEYDVYGDRQAGAVSLNLDLGATRTGDLLAGRVAPDRVLNAAQLRYLREVVGFWPLPPGLRALGPMQVSRYRSSRGRYDVDVSRLPGGEQYAEISRKVKLPDAAQTMRAMAAVLTDAGIPACTDASSPAREKLRALLRQR
jgi:hypothetical protein